MHNLTEILAVCPILQLVPKQDVAPLVAPARVSPQPLDPEAYLSRPTRRVLEAVSRPGFDACDAAATPLFSRLCAALAAYDHAGLDSVRFRRPVIAADTGAAPAVAPLAGLFAPLAAGASPVPKTALVDLPVAPGSAPREPHAIRLLSGHEPDADVRAHARHFRAKLRREQRSRPPTARKRARGQDPTGWARKKVAVDRSRLADSRLHGLYAVLEAAGDAAALSAEGLAQLETHVAALESSRSMALVPAADLRAVQELCLSRVCPQVDATHTGAQIAASLRASGVLLRILNSNLADRRLYVDTHMDRLVGFVVSLVRQLFASARLAALAPDVADCLDRLTQQLLLTAVDESVLSRIEAVCVWALFAPSQHPALEEVSESLVMCLVQIFKCYASQRSYIVNEMLSALKAAAAHKPLHRQMSVSSSAKVSSFTVFLVRLVQSFDALELRKDISHFSVLPKSDNPNSAASTKRWAIIGALDALHSECLKTVNEIADFLLHSLQAPAPNLKPICLGICDDLSVLVSRPEWPGAETLTAVLGTRFIDALGEATPPPLQPFLLELAAKFATECLKLALRCPETPTMTTDLSVPDIARLKNMHQVVLCSLRDRTARNTAANVGFQHQLFMTVRGLAMLLNDMQASPSNAEKAAEVTAVFDAFLATLGDGILASGESESTPETAMCQLVLARSLNSYYIKFLQALTSSLESKKAKLATKAIKVLSPLIELDSTILLKRKVKNSVSQLLVGDSALSRDAVIDLLGQYMFSSTELLMKYYRAIGERHSDESVSVRKRVLKLMKRVYLESTSTSVKTYAISRLLKLTEDEEKSVVELAKSALLDLLFKSPDAAQLSRVLVGAMDSGGTRLLLENFVQSTKSSDRSRTLKQIVSVTLDQIIEKTENISVDAAFQLIAILTKCEASVFTQDQLIFLQSFVVKDPGDSSDICFHALRTTKLAIPQMKVLRPDYVEKTRKSLLTSLTKFDTRELHEAVQVLQMLPSESSSLLKAAISSMKLLTPYFKSSSSPQDTAKICKLLHLLGAFASYCTFEDSRQAFGNAQVGLKSDETVVSLFAKQMLHFSKMAGETRVVATRNLLSICTFHPRLYLSPAVLNVLDTGLSEGSREVQLAIVSGLLKFLTKEDEDAMRRNESDKRSFFGASAQSLNDGVCSSLVQRYIERILGFCVVDSGPFSMVPVMFLQLVMKLGFANPKVCIATIIALEASPNKKIKRIASELHKDVFDKHESLADGNYVEAVRLAGLYVRRVNRSHLFGESLFLRSVYRVVGRTYSSRKKFILSLCRLFDLNVTPASLEAAVEQRDITIFLAMNMSVLNFSSLEEIYLLLYHLDRAITRDGIDLAERISLTIGSRNGDGMSVPNLQLLFVQSQAVLALVYLRQVLTAAYDIRSSSMEGFRPSRADIELRAQPKVVNFVDFPLANLELEKKLTEPSTFGALFTRMVSSAKDYTV